MMSHPHTTQAIWKFVQPLNVLIIVPCDPTPLELHLCAFVVFDMIRLMGAKDLEKSVRESEHKNRFKH